MFLSRKILLAAAVLLSTRLAGAATSINRDTFGISKVIWNERLRAIESDHIDTGLATYSAYALSWDRAWIDGRWGFGLGAMYGEGNASSGDFEGTTDFADTGNRHFALYGLNPRLIYRQTGQVHFSLVAPILYRTVSWNSTNEAVKVESRRSLSMTLGPEVRVLLNAEWEVLGGFSILSLNPETYWRIGLQFRL